MKKISIKELNVDACSLFKELTPICVFGDLNDHNGLTIGWGGIGILWRKEVLTVYIKPNRYTFEYANKYQNFSVMFFEQEKMKEITKVFGTMSGKDVDKDKLCNLHPIIIDDTVCYEEAVLTITLKKLLDIDLSKGRIFDEEAVKWYYQDEPVHFAYIGQIKGVYKK